MQFPLTYRAAVVPKELPADPLAVLRRFAGGGMGEKEEGDLFLLHSGNREGHSVLGIDPLCRLTVDAQGRARLQSKLPTIATELQGTPLEALQQALGRIPFAAPHPLIGWLGFLSYDIGAMLEGIPQVRSDELQWPLIVFTLFENYVVFDRAAEEVRAFGLSPNTFPWDRLEGGRASGSATGEGRTDFAIAGSSLLQRTERAEYLAKVRRVQEYIAAGDIYQANVAQRWVVGTRAEPVDLFCRLAALSPAPYAGFMQFTDTEGIGRSVLSASPEVFITLNDGRVVTRPIKGTRPRDVQNHDHDRQLRDELVASAKDRAELAMIVDLLRNDLGRVSRFGTVRVDDPRKLEQHPTLWHTVATIEAELRPEASLAEFLAAICPGGSITGAPKIRAMQIIEEIEGFRRALYCGNMGLIGPMHQYASSAGARGPASMPRWMTLNIAIRTILMQGDRAFVYAGGGIVADSVPELEYEETLHKALAMFRSLGLEVPA
jgi:anthranilate/para-aminobenzoate synthase component I